MQVAYSGLPVTFTRELRDPAGLVIDTAAVSYRIIDEDGTELVAPTAVSGFVGGTGYVNISIPGSVNELAPGVAQELRQVEMTLQLMGGLGSTKINAAYVVRSTEPLVVGVNSFQTFSHAEMTALDIPRLHAWNEASEQQKTDALIQAAARLKRFRFRIRERDYTASQQNRLAGGGYVGTLTDLTVDEFIALPEIFKKDLRLAQVAEAESILSPKNEFDEKRDAGVILDAVGETKMGFRPAPTLRMPVSREALSYIGRYISYTLRIGR